MSTQTVVPLFAAFLNVFQPNANAAEADIKAPDPAIVESLAVEADKAAEEENAKPRAILSCDLDIARSGQQRNVQVIVTAGDAPVSGSFFVEVHASGASEQIMRRGVSANLEAGESGRLFSASMTMSGEPEFAAAVQLGPMVFACPPK
ncbi:MAG: hypothetical protein NXH88_01665 [Hyphomonas sp.]|nr:hypothetical protein [Hyphomonas sp.]